ncbi:MAG TPA: RDD family protein [Phycisphaerae bacterium]|nr:RDD family protein [Phycisphaerae bacterium]
MNRLRWIALLALSAAVAAPASRAADFLVGQGEKQWLITDEAGFYRVIFRADNRWQKLPGDRQGEVQAATATEDGAVVLFGDGRSVRYLDSAQEQWGRRPPAALWPQGTKALSVCPTSPSRMGLLVLVRRPVAVVATTRAAAASSAAPGATHPATRPAVVLERRSELALLRYGRDEWEEVAVVPSSPDGAADAAFVAVVDPKTYVLLVRPDRRLLAYADGVWQSQPLPEGLAGGRVLAMFASGNDLVLAVFDPAGKGEIRLGRLAAGSWSAPFALNEPQAGAAPKPVIRPADSPPVLAPWSDGVGVAWRDDGRWVFTRFSRSGSRTAPSEDILARAEAGESASKLWDRLLIGIMVALGVLMFWPGRTVRTEPFSLPPSLRPARLGARLAAFLIDFLPFAVLSYVLAGMPSLASLMTDTAEPKFLLRARHVQAFFGSMAMFAVYGIILEHLFGATVGKMLLRLRVVGDKGCKPSLREIALRNVAKIAEVTFFYIMWPFPVLTRYRQRLGDKIAWTAVIQAPLGPLPEAPEPPPNRPDRQDEPREREKL